jgi:hypothetical protein
MFEGYLERSDEPIRPRRKKSQERHARPRIEAIGVGLSSKTLWRLTLTFGSQDGLTHAYLKTQGLVSVLDLWLFLLPAQKSILRAVQLNYKHPTE